MVVLDHPEVEFLDDKDKIPLRVLFVRVCRSASCRDRHYLIVFKTVDATNEIIEVIVPERSNKSPCSHEMERDPVQSSDADVTSSQPSNMFLDEELVVFRDLSGLLRPCKRVCGV